MLSDVLKRQIITKNTQFKRVHIEWIEVHDDVIMFRCLKTQVQLKNNLEVVN